MSSTDDQWRRLLKVLDGTPRSNNLDSVYDRNGNLTQEPNHDAAGGYNYFFNPENRLDYVQRYLSGGELEQQASYDSEGNRWLRITSSGGGKALISLRDAGGQVVADYEVKSADTGPELVKEYVRGAGGPLAVNATCGPRPELSFGELKKVSARYSSFFGHPAARPTRTRQDRKPSR